MLLCPFGSKWYSEDMQQPKTLPYFVANWKSHKTIEEAQEWLETFSKLLLTRQYQTDLSVVLAVPFPFLNLVHDWLEARGDQEPQIFLAVQDLSSFPSGKYTGAVSTRQLEGLGVSAAILGHSERRRYFHETSQDVAAKVTQALEAGMLPIVCVDDPYLEEQAAALQSAERTQVAVVYEALETIGTGVSLSTEEFEAARARIRAAFGEVPALYGGSVDSQNILEFVPPADGVLVGTASLEAADFVAIIDRYAGQ